MCNDMSTLDIFFSFECFRYKNNI